MPRVTPSIGSTCRREEFKRLGVEGDWDHPYTTMSFDAEATIAAELMKFAMNGLLYRGSKPVMWSVVERTALAEAEVEYQEHASPAIWVKFPMYRASGEWTALTRSAERTDQNTSHCHLDDDALDYPR